MNTTGFIREKAELYAKQFNQSLAKDIIENHSSEILRYFVMYEYGGFFADLDVEFYRSIQEKLLRPHTCIIAQEPLVNTLIICDNGESVEPLASNKIMICAAHHPFIKFILQNVIFKHKDGKLCDLSDRSYFHKLVHEYIQKTINETSKDVKIFLAPSDFFLPTFEKDKIPFVKKKCQEHPPIVNEMDEKMNARKKMQAMLCQKLKANNFENKPNVTTSYTYSHWLNYTSIKIMREKRNIVNFVKGELKMISFPPWQPEDPHNTHQKLYH